MRTPQRWRSLADLARYMAVEQQWVPLRKAAELYRVTPETMHAWAARGYFTSTRIQTALWISREELESGLRQQPNKKIHSHPEA